MVKRLKIDPVITAVDDRFLRTEDVQKILACSDSHIYMLAKTNQIEEIDISCSGNGGPNTKRYSLSSINALILKRKKEAFESKNLKEHLK